MDAVNLLQATGAHVLRQNQFGAAIGGPLKKDKTFMYGNYEAQRRGESPFYNSAVLGNIHAINEVKAIYGLAPEPNLGSVLRTNDSDNGFMRVDHRFSDNENAFLRYFVNDGRLLNQSPLNDGFDLPSAFKDNFYRDQSLAGTLASVINPTLVNELRLQYARRSFDSQRFLRSRTWSCLTRSPPGLIEGILTSTANRDLKLWTTSHAPSIATRSASAATLILWTPQNPFRCSILSRRISRAWAHFWEMMGQPEA